MPEIASTPALAALLHTKRTVRAGVIALVGLTASLSSAGTAVGPAQSIEGKWIAPQVGTADNHTAVGLDIARNNRGELAVRFYVPILSYFGLPLGVAEPDGEGRFVTRPDKVELSVSDANTLTVNGLVGTPVVLHRTNVLPTPPPKPKVPYGPGPKWRLSLGGAIFAPVAVRSGIAYVGNTDGILFALNVTDGSPVWTFSAGRPIYGGAWVSDDAVFFASDNGFLYKVDRAGGKELWRYDLGDARVARIPPNPLVYDYDYLAPTPVLADGRIFIGAGDGGFHAIEAGSGTRLWRIQSNAAIRTSAAIQGGNVIFSTMNGWVSSVKRADGAEVWSFKNHDAYTSGPAISDNVVVVGNRASWLRALDAASGSQQWIQTYWGSWVESTPVFRGGRGYVGSGDLFLVSCFDPKTGTNLWRTRVDGWVMQAPAVTENRVFVGVSGAHRNGNAPGQQSAALVALDRETGKILWAWPMPEWKGAFLNGFFAAPTTIDGLVLAGGVDGTLYAFPDQ